MHLIETLRDFISNYVSLSDKEFNYVTSFIELRNFRKKEKLVREGEVENYVNIIQSGLARVYFVRNHHEVIMQFSKENEIICSYESFLSGAASSFSIESLEPLVVFSITLENLEKLYEFSPKIERLGRLVATQEYLTKASFDYDRVRVSSKERFIHFLRNNPELFQRVSQKHLASYLNIKPETFSRMKHLMKVKAHSSGN
jgi:CRP-like cAMP-binding protein